MTLVLLDENKNFLYSIEGYNPLINLGIAESPGQLKIFLSFPFSPSLHELLFDGEGNYAGTRRRSDGQIIDGFDPNS